MESLGGASALHRADLGYALALCYVFGEVLLHGWIPYPPYAV